MARIAGLPDEIHERIYRAVYGMCVDELNTWFRGVHERVPVYDDDGQMYRPPWRLTPYHREAPSYDPFDTPVSLGKGVFMALRSHTDLSRALVEEYAKICTRYSPNQPCREWVFDEF